LSRLDSFIRRLLAQRACLDHAVELIRDQPGPVLELGLGNGRTYDHLRAHLPGRDIYVFERRPAAHPDCMPDTTHLIVGDLETTLAAARLPRPAALIHSDIGTGESERNARVATWLSGVLPALLSRGGLVVSDQALGSDRLEPLALPAQVTDGRYFLYRRA
jgi:hypothetical protein